MPAERTLEIYLSDDTAWSKQTVEVLKAQCNKRDIAFTIGNRKELEALLKNYRYTHNPPGKASRFGVWRSNGTDSVYRSALAEAEASTLCLIQIKNYSDLESGLWAKHFTLTPGGEERITVVVSDEVNCSCGGRGYGKTPTTRDVLRYLFNCPEPLRWQSFFLPSELGEIFRLSHLYHHFNTGGYPDPFCAICFKPMESFIEKKQCGIGKHLVHRTCMVTFQKMRGLSAGGSEYGCVLCEDADELVWEVIMKRSAARKSGASERSQELTLSSPSPTCSSSGPNVPIGTQITGLSVERQVTAPRATNTHSLPASTPTDIDRRLDKDKQVVRPAVVEFVDLGRVDELMNCLNINRDPSASGTSNTLDQLADSESLASDPRSTFASESTSKSQPHVKSGLSVLGRRKDTWWMRKAKKVYHEAMQARQG